MKLLNMAARRLFESSLTQSEPAVALWRVLCGEPGSPFARQTAILRMERSSGALLLKAAATQIAARGTRWRLISLQNIENEMSAQELEAWQTVIRVMAHEVMNSLTPVSSLAATAHGLVRDVLEQLAAGRPACGRVVGCTRCAGSSFPTERRAVAFRAQPSSANEAVGSTHGSDAGAASVRTYSTAARERPRRSRRPYDDARRSRNPGACDGCRAPRPGAHQSGA